MYQQFGIRNSYLELHNLYFWTATINKWQNLLEDVEMKQVILDSLAYLSELKKIKIYAFVIMPNHIHLVIECMEMNGKEMPHVSFLKYTAHKFKKTLLSKGSSQLRKYWVQRSNKNYEFWQRDSFAFELSKQETTWQKIDYIHNNPLQKKWNLCERAEDYEFSSARFYLENLQTFSFLVHIDEAL